MLEDIYMEGEAAEKYKFRKRFEQGLNKPDDGYSIAKIDARNKSARPRNDEQRRTKSDNFHRYGDKDRRNDVSYAAATGRQKEWDMQNRTIPKHQKKEEQRAKAAAKQNVKESGGFTSYTTEACFDTALDAIYDVELK